MHFHNCKNCNKTFEFERDNDAHDEGYCCYPCVEVIRRKTDAEAAAFTNDFQNMHRLHDNQNIDIRKDKK